MTLAEAEQAVIRAAIELRDRLYSRDVDHGDHGEQLGNVCLTVDALLALRLADAGGETDGHLTLGATLLARRLADQINRDGALESDEWKWLNEEVVRKSKDA